MYDPYIGRFMQQDPDGFSAGDINLYRYVHNDPLNATDPSGLAERPIIDAEELREQAWLRERTSGTGTENMQVPDRGQYRVRISYTNLSNREREILFWRIAELRSALNDVLADIPAYGPSGPYADRSRFEALRPSIQGRLARWFGSPLSNRQILKIRNVFIGVRNKIDRGTSFGKLLPP